MVSLNEHEPMTQAETIQYLKEVLKSRNTRVEQLLACIEELKKENADLHLALDGAKRVISIAATLTGKEKS